MLLAWILSGTAFLLSLGLIALLVPLRDHVRRLVRGEPAELWQALEAERRAREALHRRLDALDGRLARLEERLDAEVPRIRWQIWGARLGTPDSVSLLVAYRDGRGLILSSVGGGEMVQAREVRNGAAGRGWLQAEAELLREVRAWWGLSSPRTES